MIEAAVKRRQPIPEAIARAPSLLEGLEFYYEAFAELSTCRGLSDMGNMGPIPWTAIDAYARRYGLDDDDFETLARLVRALDDHFIKHTMEKRSNG